LSAKILFWKLSLSQGSPSRINRKFEIIFIIKPFNKLFLKEVLNPMKNQSIQQNKNKKNSLQNLIKSLDVTDYHP
jgi:hypothetical protein